MQKTTCRNVEQAIDGFANRALFEQVIPCLHKGFLWLVAIGAIACASMLGNPVAGQDAPVRGEPTLQPWVGKVKGSLVNIRTGPSLNHYAFLRLPDGSSLISVGGQGDWIEVAVPSDRPVWMHSDYLVPEGNFFRVNGSRVRLRATAGTNHAPLGLSESGQVLVPTGNVSGDGSWVEVLAPLNAHAWIHGDYIRRTDQQVNPLHLTSLHQSLKGQVGITGVPVAKDSRGATENPGATDADEGSDPDAPDTRQEGSEPNTVTIPVFDSPKLKSLFDSFRTETLKNPVDWNFSEILKEVKNIEVTSEDVGEIEIVRDLSKTIQEHFVPLHRRLVEIQRQQDEARAKRELVRVKENDILRRTGHRSSNPDVKYQAVGWVVPLGKHRDVEATHKLLKGNKLLYYLDGGEIELDQYVNKRVGIVGTVVEQEPSTGARLIHIQKIEILSR